MDYVREGADNVTLALRKSWFFFEDTVVCLMGGTDAGSVSGPLVSSLEQCRLRGPVTVRKSDGKVEELRPAIMTSAGRVGSSTTTSATCRFTWPA